MKNDPKIDLYLDVVIKEGLYSRKSQLNFKMETLFKDIELNNKNILDIGGGSGAYSFYAASRGAKKVVCLEPGAEGSSSVAVKKFNSLKNSLRDCNVELNSSTIQLLKPEQEKFDVIILHNSINHLDETACINLQREEKYKSVYQEAFSKIYSLANKDARLLICDCSRHNFFASLKIRNPFAPHIEWHKHQTPEVWTNLLSEVGFVDPEIKWSSFNALRELGRVLMGYKWVSYFLRSHFRLTMAKP